MNLPVTISLVAWPFVVLAMFALMRPRVAVGAAYAMAWSFLPVAELNLLPALHLNKATTTGYAVIVGTLLFNFPAIGTFRPKWADLFMVAFCLCPFASSISNGLGAYDGGAAVFSQSLFWGLPYLVGRIYFRRPEHLRELGWSIVACAIAYVPFCLWEAKMSPQLHLMLYGFRVGGFGETVRGGGFRPTVFMPTGLMVATWMGSALLLAVTVRYLAGLKSWKGWRTGWIVGALAVTFVLLRSMGAFVFVVGGVALMWLARRGGKTWPLMVIPLGIVLYLGVRATGTWSGEMLTNLASSASEDRADSLQFRLDNEDILVAKARQHPLLGWGGWGRNRVFDENGKDVSITDGLWIIIFGTQGLVGLTSFYVVMLAGPSVLLLRSDPRRWKGDPNAALAAGMSVVCLLEAADTLPNAMPIAVFTVMLGAITGIAFDKRPIAVSPARQAPIGRPGPAVAAA